MAQTPYYDALPTDLVPVHYDISVFDIDTDNDTYKGIVNIHLDVKSPTKSVSVNYRDLWFKPNDIIVKAFKAGQSHDIGVTNIIDVAARESKIITFNQSVGGFESLIVTINYDAKIQHNMAGFYRSDYEEDGVKKVMLSTQFEAPDARRAFPCLDEPSLKATFTIDLTIRDDWTGLANMPVQKTQNLQNNLKKIWFEPTPKMSSYLVAWCCGDFEYIESFTSLNYYDNKPLPIRIYTTKGYSNTAKFASEITPKIIDHYSTIFDIKYPLPKLDLIAVHTFSHNAMENWGLVTYRSNALLYNEKTSGPSFAKQVCYVIAHEMAHQWFGDLVTMKWWDELWLNEGFATFVGYLAVDHLKPEWSIFDLVVSESQQLALDLDGLRSSHPIHVPVNDAVDIDQLFDFISYHKGCSIIAMLSNYVGRDTFLKGVSNYLKANLFSNGTTHDLWSAIAEVSHKPVVKMMENWIAEIGFPLIDVEFNDDKLVLTQSRFLSTGDIQQNEDSTLWWLPLNISTGPNPKDKFQQEDSFQTKTLTIDNFVHSSNFFKLNKDSTGFYRVNYSNQIFHENILPNLNQLSPKDKISLFADVLSVSVSGVRPHTNTITFLELVKSTLDTDQLGENYAVWADLGEKLSKLQVAFSEDDELIKSVRNFTSSVYEKIGLGLLKGLKANNGIVDESNFLKVNLISIISTQCGLLQIPEFVEYAEYLFDYLKHGQIEKIHPSLTQFVFSTISSSPDLSQENFDLIVKEITNPSTLDSREVAIKALPSISNMKYLPKLFEYLLDPKIIPIMDCHYMAKNMTLNPRIRHKFWEFIKDNYCVLYKNLSINVAVMERFIRFTFVNYQSEFMIQDFRSFFEKQGIVGFERSFDQVLDSIKTNANWCKRDNEKVRGWLKANNY